MFDEQWLVRTGTQPRMIMWPLSVIDIGSYQPNCPQSGAAMEVAYILAATMARNNSPEIA